MEWSLALLRAAVVRGEVWLRENILMAFSEVKCDEGVRREVRQNGILRLAGFSFFPVECHVHVHENATSEDKDKHKCRNIRDYTGSLALKLYIYTMHI